MESSPNAWLLESPALDLWECCRAPGTAQGWAVPPWPGGEKPPIVVGCASTGPRGLGKETPLRTTLPAGRNKDTRLSTGEKAGSRGETRHQSQNAELGRERGVWVGAGGTAPEATPPLRLGGDSQKATEPDLRGGLRLQLWTRRTDPDYIRLLPCHIIKGIFRIARWEFTACHKT